MVPRDGVPRNSSPMHHTSVPCTTIRRRETEVVSDWSAWHSQPFQTSDCLCIGSSNEGADGDVVTRGIVATCETRKCSGKKIPAPEPWERRRRRC
jgi:hypothetical protein